MMELKPCTCKHGLNKTTNFIGEIVVYCDITGQWMNVSLGDCEGNCESEEQEG